MLGKVISKVTDPKTRYLAMTAGGMGALLLGRKATAVGLFTSGMLGLERLWREERDFQGGWAERWEQSIAFYEETHAHDMNRKLHMAGIPIIMASTVGLLVSRPPFPLWLASAGGFVFGWGLNFVGHGFYEKNAPAFQDDPLSFFAGPVWDLQQVRAMRSSGGAVEAAAAE